MGMLCEMFDHKWKYNFTSMPNKRICCRCKIREALNLRTLEWSEKFTDKRSDEELIKKWHL